MHGKWATRPNPRPNETRRHRRRKVVGMSTADAGDGATPVVASYELVFSAIHGGRSFAFPCDCTGKVELNALSERARDNYLMARTLVGRDFHAPTVLRTHSSG